MEDDTKTTLEESVSEESSEQSTAFDVEAREMGWRPKEEFRGDESRWVDAETFVKRGHEVLPLVKAENKRLKREIDEIKATMQEFKAHHATVKQRAYDDAVVALRKMQSDAVTRGDGDAFAQISAEMENLTAEVAKQPAPSGPDPTFLSWKDQNPWYGTDPDMTRMADTLGQGLRSMNPNADGVEILKAVEVDIRNAFPHKFSQKRSTSSVDGAGRPEDRGGKKSYNALPQDAKAACDRFVKQGVMTKEQYVKEYYGEN